MLPRIAILASLLVSLVLLPGCPGASALVGTWAFTIETTLVGIALNADGSAAAVPIPPNNTLLDGTLSWEANYLTTESIDR